MGFVINFDEENVSEGFELVAEGKYEATIINAELQVFQGNPSFDLTLEIRSDVNQPHQGAKLLYNTLYFTSSNPEYAENTERKRNAFLKACGYTGKKQLDLEKVVKEIYGKNVLITVKHEANKNDPTKIYAKAKWYAESKVDKPQNEEKITVGEDDLPF